MTGSLIKSFLLLMLTIGAAAEAQGHVQDRTGGWVSMGGGVSRTDLKCTGCASSSTLAAWEGGPGSTGFVGFGYGISPQLLPGVEVNLSTRGGRSQISVNQFLLVTHFFPIPAKGLRIDAGAGLVVYELGRSGGSVTANGLAGRLGAAWDIAVTRQFAVSPYVNVARTNVRTGSVNSYGNAGSVTRIENSIVSQLGISVQRYWGDGSQVEHR